MNYYEQIYFTDDKHYAYHITHKDNMKGIIEKGLLPLCGSRSYSIEDYREVICFFIELHKGSLGFWLYELYLKGNKFDTGAKNTTIQDLELLRFNLKYIKWFVQKARIQDFYTYETISNKELQYLRLYGNNGNQILLNDFDSAVDLRWNALDTYVL
jgi:hypothetical protein